MANYYTDIPELKYHLNNPMMKRICELKERNYRDKEEFDYAPQDYADAMDSYDKILDEYSSLFEMSSRNVPSKTGGILSMQ